MGEIKPIPMEELEELELGQDDPAREYKWVALPGGKVRIQTLTANEFLQVAEMEDDMILGAICMAVVDANGRTKHAFDEQSLERLANMPSGQFKPLSDAVMTFSLQGVTKEGK